MCKDVSEDAPKFIDLSCAFRHARKLVGLSCMLAWISALTCFEGVLRDDRIFRGDIVHDPCFIGITLGATIAFFVRSISSAVREKRSSAAKGKMPDSFLSSFNGARAANGARGSNGPRIANGAHIANGTVVANKAIVVPAACASAFCVFATGWADDSAGPLVLIGGLACGVGMAHMTIAWAELLARMDLREALVIVSAAVCAQWLVFVGALFLPLPLKALLSATLPLASFALIRFDRREIAGITAREGAGSTRHHATKDVPRALDSDVVALRRIALASFLFAFAIQFTLAFFVKMLPHPLAPELFPLTFALIFACGAVIMFGTLAAMNRAGSYRLELYWRATFLLCTASAGTFLLADFLGVFSYLSIYVGHSLVISTLWMLALGYSYMTKCPPARAFSATFCMQYLGLFVGLAGVNAIAGMQGALFDIQLASSVSVAAIILFSVSYATVFPERSLLSLSPTMFGVSSSSREQRYRFLGDRFGLTEREVEVLASLAVGHNTAHIEKSLFISKNTVATHRKSIYRKLGIHSQQELITLVEGEVPD